MPSKTIDLKTAVFRIKPLQWTKKFDEYYQQFQANVPMGSYTVERNREDSDPQKPWDKWQVRYFFDEYYDEGSQDVQSAQEGKQWAADDWISRITPALAQIESRAVLAQREGK